MIIFINKPKPFEAGVILRTLYYSTELDNIEIYINGKLNKSSLYRYSRIPLDELKKVKFEIPIIENGVYVNPKAKNTVFAVKDIDNLVIDFSGEYKGKFKEIKGLGINLLHYEAISVIYHLFIRNLKFKIPNIKNKLDENSLYIAKKLLEFIDEEIINYRKLQYILQHVHKKYNVIVSIKKYEILGDYKNFYAKYYVEFYDKNLRKIKDATIEITNNKIKIPIVEKNRVEYREFYIDKNKRRVYITKEFYVDERKNIIFPNWF